MDVQPLLILVSGPPATGKTTLARLLAQRYTLPLFAKDTLKEMMYDNMSALPSLEESRFLGKCSIDSLYIAMQELLRCGISHILEANFNSHLWSSALQTTAQTLPFACVQIQMQCEGAVLVERFRARAASAAIHPGHQGLTYMDAMLPALLEGKSTDLDIPSTVVRIDTTHEHAIDYQPAFTAIEQMLPMR